MGSLGNLLFLITGAVAATAVTVVVMRKKGLIITSLHPLPPGELAAYKSGLVQMTNVVLTHVNSNVTPALYNATLTYSDGSQNKNAVLYASNIEDLLTLGIRVQRSIDNPQDIPSNDRLVIA